MRGFCDVCTDASMLSLCAIGDLLGVLRVAMD
jgi:hypothetical protein